MEIGKAVENLYKPATQLTAIDKLKASINPTNNFVGVIDRTNKRFKELRGVDAMAGNNTVKEAVRSTLASNVSKTVAQYGNSTHESLFGVAFLFQDI